MRADEAHDLSALFYQLSRHQIRRKLPAVTHRLLFQRRHFYPGLRARMFEFIELNRDSAKSREGARFNALTFRAGF
jgi:hypothetical protein